MGDNLEPVIVEHITALRAEWRLYPDIYAEKLAEEIRKETQKHRFVRGSRG